MLRQQEPLPSSLLQKVESDLQKPDAPPLFLAWDEAHVEWNERDLPRFRWKIALAASRPVSIPDFLQPLARWSDALHRFRIRNARFYPFSQEKGLGSPREIELETDPKPKPTPKAFQGLHEISLPPFSEAGLLEIDAELSPVEEKEATPRDAFGPYWDAAFSFRWNTPLPAGRRELHVFLPKKITLRAFSKNLPPGIRQETLEKEEGTWHHFSLEGTPPIPVEPFPPPLEEIVPLTAFTPHASWKDACRKAVDRIEKWKEKYAPALDNLLKPLLEETTAEGSSLEKASAFKRLFLKKFDVWETAFPAEWLPLRDPDEAVQEGVLSPEETALWMGYGFEKLGFTVTLFRFRPADRGSLLRELPALQQTPSFLLLLQKGAETLWVDPLEPFAAPGVLAFTRLETLALSLEKKPQWKWTPPFSARDHRKERDITFTLSAEGHLTADVSLRAFGAAEVSLRRFLAETPPLQRKEKVEKALQRRFPKAVLLKYEATNPWDVQAPAGVDYRFQIPDYAEILPNKKLKFYPLVLQDVEELLAHLSPERRTPVFLNHSFNEITRLLVHLPPGSVVGSLPPDENLAGSVAEFSSKTKVDLGVLTLERYSALKKRSIPPGDPYQELLNFYRAVLKQDRVLFEVSLRR